MRKRGNEEFSDVGSVAMERRESTNAGVVLEIDKLSNDLRDSSVLGIIVVPAGKTKKS